MARLELHTRRAFDRCGIPVPFYTTRHRKIVLNHQFSETEGSRASNLFSQLIVKIAFYSPLLAVTLKIPRKPLDLFLEELDAFDSNLTKSAVSELSLGL